MHRFRIGVLTSGGDCPGLNAVIRAAVASAHTLGWEVLGFIDGYEGLLSPVNYKILTLENTQGIMPIGGTIIGTTNRGRFVAKQGLGEKALIPQPIIDEAKKTLQDLGVRALICIGGDGSLTTADQLFENGVQVVGVPKTIDNDLSATATTFGFDSAVQCVADALDRLHTTAASHKRVMVLEVMGRHAGWIALHGGLAGGADVILIPEIPFSYERLARACGEAHVGWSGFHADCGGGGCDGHRAARPRRWRVRVKGEDAAGWYWFSRSRHEIGERTKRETRTVVLGHLQRVRERPRLRTATWAPASASVRCN